MRCCDMRYVERSCGTLPKARVIAVKASFSFKARGAASYFSANNQRFSTRRTISGVPTVIQ